MASFPLDREKWGKSKGLQKGKGRQEPAGGDRHLPGLVEN